MDFRPKIQLDFNALKHNLSIAKQSAPNSHIMAAIKANAYGHGLIPCAQALQQADAFAVARICEGLELRQAGFQHPIVILEGANNTAEIQTALEQHFILVLHHISQLSLIKKIKKPLKIWIKIDTGMHRIGFLPDQIHSILAPILNHPYLQLQGLLTHLANADNPNDPKTAQQIQQIQTIFKRVQNQTPQKLVLSIANSAGILAWKASHQTWNRPGIMLYGASPIINTTADTFNLKPVMTFKSRIIAIQNYQKGDTIGYSGCYCCPKKMRVGVIAVGYGDGYPRHAKNGTPILIHKKKCQLLGRVSMDMISVDLTSIPQAKIGDRAILWGKELAIEEIATQCDSISYALFCGISERVIRK